MNDLKTISNAADKKLACKDCRAQLPDLLFGEASGAEARKLNAHIASCAACAQEVAELRATFAALDAWTAPEPSPYFDTRLHARLREEQAAAPEGFFERARSFLLYSTGRHLRPAMAGALALVVLAGSGSFLGVNHKLPGQTTQASATVNDLRILDNNAQALQQMDQLLDDSNDDQDAPPTT